MLTESPCDPLHRRLQRLRYLYPCFDCYRAERTSSREGLPPSVDQRLFTAHQTLTHIAGDHTATVSFKPRWLPELYFATHTGIGKTRLADEFGRMAFPEAVILLLA